MNAPLTHQPKGSNQAWVAGVRVAPNDVRIRPGTDDKGPRIDIPGNGDKPPETIHFPPGG